MKIEKWDSLHNYGMFILTVIFLFYSSIVPFIIYSIISFGILWTSQWYSIKHLKPAGGIPNYITLLRYIILLLLAVSAGKIPERTLVIGFFIIIILDGADGYFARKLNQRSALGSIFDMETDSLLVCLMSCLLYLKGFTGAWILLAGFIKYYYVVFTGITKLNKGPEEKSLFGASVAVFVFITLTLAFIMPHRYRMLTALSGTIFLCISFGYSLYKSFYKKIREKNVY